MHLLGALQDGICNNIHIDMTTSNVMIVILKKNEFRETLITNIYFM